MSGVKCMVEECAYNKNHVCTASQIEVGSSMTTVVDNTEATACKTFTPREQQ